MKSPLLRLTLRRGSVYMMRHTSLTSPLPHYLVVVNLDPLADEVLVLAVVTSNISLRRARAAAAGQPPETVVEFGPADYSVLDHPSCIDCNDVKRLRTADLDRAVCARPSISRPDLPEPVLRRVVAGILASSRVAEDIKALVRPTA